MSNRAIAGAVIDQEEVDVVVEEHQVTIDLLVERACQLCLYSWSGACSLPFATDIATFDCLIDQRETFGGNSTLLQHDLQFIGAAVIVAFMNLQQFLQLL